jgi:formamidase
VSETTQRLEVRAGRPLAAQPGVGHNRWHPDIEPRARVAAGTSLVIETLDAMDGQLTPGSDAGTVASSNLNRVHPLSGPVHVDGAAPGDLLVVTITAIETQSFGFTAQIPGFGFLRDVFPDPFYVAWTIHDHVAESPTLPGVRIPEAAFMGIVGVAPSAELLAGITMRERELFDRGGAVHLPDPRDAIPDDPSVAAAGLRTTPPREIGGNLDVRHLGAGCTLFLPVFVDGARFSCGDMHFAQGDGEVCGTAIEVAGQVHLTVDLRKGAATGRRAKGVWFQTEEPARPAPRAVFATTGGCVDDEGRNHSENASLAARNALLSMIEHIVEDRGYTAQQAYAICSVAVNLQLSQAVDVPNYTATALLPLEIFV